MNDNIIIINKFMAVLTFLRILYLHIFPVIFYLQTDTWFLLYTTNTKNITYTQNKYYNWKLWWMADAFIFLFCVLIRLH